MTNRKLTAGAAGLAVIAAGGLAAVGASGQSAPEIAVVKQKFSLKMKPNRYIQDGMRFDRDVYPVQSGGKVRLVLNQPQEGPHTLTLVKRADLPRNAQEAFNCKVCNRLGKAHGADPNSDAPPKFPFLENGKGQKTPPNFDRPGDSGLTGPDKGDKFTANVTAKPGTTRHILCLIHPWMQAKLAVK